MRVEIDKYNWFNFGIIFSQLHENTFKDRQNGGYGILIGFWKWIIKIG